MDEAQFEAELAKRQKKIDALKKVHAVLEKKAKQSDAKIAKLNGFKFALDGYKGAYMKAVKNTDGLISVAPSCMKAIQNVEKIANLKTVATAIKSIEEQKKKVEKEHGKEKDKDVKKRVATFNATLDKMSKQMRALL